MSNTTPPTITLAPRAPKGREILTVTTDAGVTVFITDEITVYITDTVDKTVSVFDTSFITTTTTVTSISTVTSRTTIPTTITETVKAPTPTTTPTTTEKEPSQLIPFTGKIQSSTSLLPLPTPFCTTIAPAPTHIPEVGKHVDPFQVLSIVFGVFILFLLALMWFLVRRFYKMYRAERVLRKQVQTEGTEMPAMGMVGGGGERGVHVVGEE